MERVPIAPEIRDKHFDLATRNAPPDLLDRACKNMRAAVRLVIAIDAGDIRGAQAHLRHGFRHAKWLPFIRRAHRPPRWHGTESARPRANVPENHERGRALLPALAHVRAARALAHRVQVESPHQALQVLIALSTQKPDPQPVRPRLRLRPP